MSAPDMFPTEGYVHFAEHEADWLSADARSRKTSRLCRCTRHGLKECGNLAESLPNRPLCWPCYAAAQDERDCPQVQVEKALEREREAQTHCLCGGTLIEASDGIKCAACGLGLPA